MIKYMNVISSVVGCSIYSGVNQLNVDRDVWLFCNPSCLEFVIIKSIFKADWIFYDISVARIHKLWTYRIISFYHVVSGIFSQTFFLLTETSFYLRIQHFKMIAEREYVHIVGYHYYFIIATATFYFNSCKIYFTTKLLIFFCHIYLILDLFILRKARLHRSYEKEITFYFDNNVSSHSAIKS